MRSNYIFLGPLDALSSDLLKFLCVKDRKPGEGPRLPPTLPQKKINGFARFTKMGREDVGGGGGGGAATDKHQTDQSRFYLCCGYKGVGVHFVQSVVTSNMTEKN